MRWRPTRRAPDWVCTAVTFMCSLANSSEMSRSRPGRSAASTHTFTGYSASLSPAWRPTRPRSRAPGWRAHLAEVAAVARWIATPARASRSRRWRRAAPAGSSAPAWSSATPRRPPARRLGAAPRRAAQRDRLVGRGRRLGGRSSASMLRSENSSLPTTSNSASALRKPSRAARSSSLSAVRPSRCSSFSTSSRPRAMVCVLCARVEPGTHLGVRARALQVASSALSQSSDGPPSFAAMTSTVWPLASARVQRHHRAVDTRAAAAVAEIGVHRIGEVDRRRAGRQLDHLACGVNT